MIEKTYNSFDFKSKNPKTVSKSVKLDSLADIVILRKEKKCSLNISDKRHKLYNQESNCSNNLTVKSILKSKNSTSKNLVNICFVDKSPLRKKQIAEIIKIKSYKNFNAENAFNDNHYRSDDDDDGSCKCIFI